MSNNQLRVIVDSVPKKDIAMRVLDHLGLRDERVYSIDIYLQKLSYIFTETYLSGKGQVNMIEALEQAELAFVNYIFSQENSEFEEFSMDAFSKYKDVDMKMLSQNDPYQLELTEDSLLLDFFTKHMSKGQTLNESYDE